QLTGEDPATGERYDHADRAGDRAGDRRRPEDANRNEVVTLELLRILRSDDQDVREEEHHRQAPDHRDGGLKGDVNPNGGVGITAEEKRGDRRDVRGDTGLHQNRVLWHFVAVDTADEG